MLIVADAAVQRLGCCELTGAQPSPGVAVGRWRSAAPSCCCCRRRRRWARRCRRWSASTRARCAATARSIAALYAGNTFGAVVGVLAAAFWLIPRSASRAPPASASRSTCSCGVASLVCSRRRAGAPPRCPPSCGDSPRRARGVLIAARAHRPARDRLRGARRPRAQPGHREHRLHLRDAAGGLPRRHRRRRRRLPALAARAGAIAHGWAIGCCACWPLACLLGTASLWAAERGEGVGAAARFGAGMRARRSPPRRRWRCSRSGRRRS